jgi:hypothetical protein
LDQLIKSIREAVKKDCLIPALVTALTVPDAMGQCLYPNIVHKNGARDIGRQYAQWFDKWVKDDEYSLPGLPSDDKPDIQIMNGSMCYQLRCSLLHSGDYDVSVDGPLNEDADFKYAYHFELRMHACNGVIESWVTPDRGQKATQDIDCIVDVGHLALAICDGAARCLKETRFSSEKPYPEFSIVDLKEWSERIRQ